MMRLLLTIIKTDFQYDCNAGLDEAGVLFFVANENDDNKHYNNNNVNNRNDDKRFNNYNKSIFDYDFRDN